MTPLETHHTFDHTYNAVSVRVYSAVKNSPVTFAIGAGDWWEGSGDTSYGFRATQYHQTTSLTDTTETVPGKPYYGQLLLETIANHSPDTLTQERTAEIE